MINFKSVVFFLGLVLILLGCSSQTKSDPSPTKPSTDTQKLINLVNAKRSTGCKCGGVEMPTTTPLVWNDKLEKAAKIHSQDMADNEFLNITGSDGSSPQDRLTRVGYQATRMVSDVAWGYPDEKAVIQGWIDKPSVCKNMMNPDFSELGIAKVGDYWTIILSRPN